MLDTAKMPQVIYQNAITDNLFVGVIVTNKPGKIVFANSVAADWLGYSCDELTNHTLQEIFPELTISEIPEDKVCKIELNLNGNRKKRLCNFKNTRLLEATAGIEGNHITFSPLSFLDETEERLRIEESLQTERNFTANILDTIEALIIVIDRFGKIMNVNRACERFFGYSKNEFVHLRIWDLLFQSQDNVTIHDLLANIQSGLSPFQYANRWKNSDGEHKLIAWSSSMIFEDDSDEISNIVAVGIDVTDRQNFEKLLTRERMLLRGLIDSIPDLIFYKDAEGKYLGWNQAFSEFRQPKIRTQKDRYTDTDFYETDLVREFKMSDQQVLETGEALTYENWTINSEDQPVLLETRKTPYYGPENEIIGVIGIGRDITRHRLVENALRTTNLEIEQLIASLSSILIALDTDLKITRWNPMAARILNIQSDEAIGKSIHELSLNWNWNAVNSGIDRCLQEKNSIYLEPLKFQRKSGNEGYLGINVSPIFGNEDSLTGYILLGADITEKQIMEARLAQTQKLESIGQLAAGIAHEINTPIQYIGDNTYFLQQSFTTMFSALSQLGDSLQDADSITPELLTQIQESFQLNDLEYLLEEVPVAIEQTLSGVQRVTEIVNAMRGFSHPGVKTRTTLNINRALEDTITVARNEWKYVADLETDFAPDLPDVICQPGEINQVFLNIIVNAANAIEEVWRKTECKGKIAIKTQYDADHVKILISDTGSGIPKEIQSRIFEPFFTTKDVGKGTGQGLAIAFDIIETKHGGTLSFDTQVGIGTTFTISLPIHHLFE